MTEDPNGRRSAAVPTSEEQDVTEQDATAPDTTAPDTTAPDLTEQLMATPPDRQETAPIAEQQPAEPPAPVASAARARRGPSVPTIVWGLLFGLIAVVVMIGQTTEVDLNLEVSGPLVLLAAGVVLVIWGVAGLGRSRRSP